MKSMGGNNTIDNSSWKGGVKKRRKQKVLGQGLKRERKIKLTKMECKEE